MHTETALSGAFKKAGGDPSKALLRSIAVDTLRKHNLSPSQAASPFTDEVRDAAGILVALMGEQLSFAKVRPVALKFLEQVAADMRGPKRSGGAHGSIDGHGRSGPAGSTVSPSGDGSVHGCAESQMEYGAPDKREGDGIQETFDGQRANGPSSSPTGNDAVFIPLAAVGRSSIDGRFVALPKHNRPRGLEALKLMKQGFTSVFDSVRIRDGRPVGDLSFGEIGTMIAANKREAALLTLIKDYAQVQPATMKVRDVIGEDELMRMVEKAAKIAEKQAETPDAA